MKLRVVRGEALLVFGAGATAGSGFVVKDSKGGSFAPPTDKGFWSKINDVAGRENIQTPALDRLRARLRLDSPTASLEEVWNLLAIHKKYVAQNFLPADRKTREEIYNHLSIRAWVEEKQYTIEHAEAAEAEMEMFRLLAHMYGRSVLLERGGGAYDALLRSIESLSRFMAPSVLSYNYDCTFESEMSLKERDFYYPNFEPFPMMQNSIPFLKLHGSLNWAHGLDGFVRSRLARFGSKVMSPDEVRDSVFDPGEIGNFGTGAGSYNGMPQRVEYWSPMVIPPVLFKEELFFNTGQERVRTHFENIWRLALDRVRRADLIVFVGYSFPAADPHARWLFNLKKEELPVFVIDVDRTQELRLKSILGPKTIFCYCGLKPDAECITALISGARKCRSQ